MINMLPAAYYPIIGKLMAVGRVGRKLIEAVAQEVVDIDDISSQSVVNKKAFRHVDVVQVRSRITFISLCSFLLLKFSFMSKKLA